MYTFSLGLGAVGLGAMAFGGLARHAGPSHAGPSHAGPSHAGPSDAGHAGGHGSGGHGGPSSAGPGDAGHAGGHGSSGHGHGHLVGTGDQHLAATHGRDAFHGGLASLLSPRVLFGILLGFGTAGVVCRPWLDGSVLFLLAIVVGVAFERLLLTPLGNFTLRFASHPALTLETAIAGEATAVTAFDGNGQGIVQIDLDGQLVQVLATLTSRDRALGHRVRPGETLRVEEVDPERNRCRVTLL
jgi:hypothetical protein